MKAISVNYPLPGNSQGEAFIKAFRTAAENMREALEPGETLQAQVVTQGGEIVYIGYVGYVEPEVLVIYGQKQEGTMTVMVMRYIPELLISVVKESDVPHGMGFHTISKLFKEQAPEKVD